MDRGSNAPSFFDQEDRKTVSRPDDQEKTAQASHCGIASKPPLGSLLDKVDTIGMHLV